MNLPAPPVPNLKVFDEEQKVRALKHAPQNTQFARANAVIKETEIVPPSLLTRFQIEDYAEALAMLGRFDEAAKYDKPEYYNSLWDAVWSEDKCTCTPNTIPVMENGRPVHKTYSHSFPMKEVFSLKLGREATLFRCNKCGTLSCK